jgi:hypothetical protein
MLDTYRLYVNRCNAASALPEADVASPTSRRSEIVSPSGLAVETDPVVADHAVSRARTPDDWVASFAEGWRARRGPDAFVAHFRQLLAEDVRLVQPQLPAIVGYAGFEKRFVRPLFTLIPDLYGEVERWAAREDTLYIELALRGTLGRRPITWRACDRITLCDGLAVERESYYDATPLLAALARSPRSWPRFARLRMARPAAPVTVSSAR